MNEDKIREIIRDEMQRNYMSGSPDIPPHSHNGTDNINIQSQDIDGFSTLSSLNNGLLSLLNLKGAFIINDTSKGSCVYPIPVIWSETGDGVNLGNAPVGTVIIINDATVTNPSLYIKVNRDGYSGRQWAGVELIL